MRAVLALALPLMMNSAVQLILNLTDTWFIGRLSTSAMAAMGQPLLGDGVRAASRRKRVSEDPPLTTASNSAVMRAGSQPSTSSARAAPLPAQAQLRPW